MSRPRKWPRRREVGSSAWATAPSLALGRRHQVSREVARARRCSEWARISSARVQAQGFGHTLGQFSPAAPREFSVRTMALCFVPSGTSGPGKCAGTSLARFARIGQACHCRRRVCSVPDAPGRQPGCPSNQATRVRPPNAVPRKLVRDTADASERSRCQRHREFGPCFGCSISSEYW